MYLYFTNNTQEIAHIWLQLGLTSNDYMSNILFTLFLAYQRLLQWKTGPIIILFL